jgi:hypothetical protein
MKKTILCLFLINLMLASKAFANDLSVKYSSDINSSDKLVMETTLNEVSALLPLKMKEGLPKDIEIKIEQLTDHVVIPDEVCDPTTANSIEKKERVNLKDRPFIYGSYNQYKNVLTINKPVLGELQNGRMSSKRINCQHKSLYDQAIATIIHELTHAYDFHNGRISNSIEFIRRAGFKKGLLRTKSKNVEAMRSADVYELVNIAESFAVNMEYFAMDPEFFCRKPSMFNFYKQLFEVDPFPNRTCTVNNIVMVSTQSNGPTPTSLDVSRVYRIDYLLASSGKGLSSGFGHSMFRIVMCAPERYDEISKKIIPATPFGKKCIEDKLYHLVVSYRANVEDATLSYMKGIFGGYPSMLFILNFSDVLDEYNRDELRDIVSYPLNLTAKEREEFVLRVIEEHWNYRGSYKFINNNCAVESYDLLKSALDRSQLNKKSSLSPKGVLSELDSLNFLSEKSKEVETYKAKTDQIILAYKEAYGYKIENAKDDKIAVQKFVDESTTKLRMDQFLKFTKTKIADSELNTELVLLKSRLIVASSFSVMEQQILRTLALKYRKSAAEMFMNSSDIRVKKLMKETKAVFSPEFTELSNTGYGIPFTDEMVSKEDLASKVAEGVVVMGRAEILLKELMPDEFKALDGIQNSIKIFNLYSLSVRKDFRTKLDVYVRQVLKNLTNDDYSKGLLAQAANGDTESLNKVRAILGNDLVSDKEILDVKLMKLIQEVL